jgi:hypothetical protein
MRIAQIILNLIAAGAAIPAGIYWFMSAKVQLPETFTVRVSKAINSSGLAQSPELQRLGQLLKYQSKLSALAARFACASAAAQAIAIVLGVLIAPTP